MLETNTDATKSDIKSFSKDASTLLGEVGSAVADKAAEARNKSMAMLDSTLAKAKGMQTSAVENSKKLARSTDAYVQENPWRAVTISAGIGLLLGFLMKNRS